MTDFEYVPEDVALMKSTKFNLEKVERSGFLFGTVVGIPAGLLIGQIFFGKLNRGLTRLCFPLFTGAFLYYRCLAQLPLVHPQRSPGVQQDLGEDEPQVFAHDQQDPRLLTGDSRTKYNQIGSQSPRHQYLALSPSFSS